MFAGNYMTDIKKSVLFDSCTMFVGLWYLGKRR